jgi:hypothetical protein
MTNRLYYGDNLEVLHEQIADASVDLVYLDPPFNSNAGYNVLFVDGWFNYQHDDRGHTRTGVISVKAGDNVNPNMVRDLGRVMQRDGHEFGLFVMKGLPTKGMEAEANSHPLVETQWGRFPALQIVTLAELFAGKRPALPPLISPVKKAQRVETRKSHQKGAQGTLI